MQRDESAHLCLVAPALTFVVHTPVERSGGTSPSCPVPLSAASEDFVGTLG